MNAGEGFIQGEPPRDHDSRRKKTREEGDEEGCNGGRGRKERKGRAAIPFQLRKRKEKNKKTIQTGTERQSRPKLGSPSPVTSWCPF